MGGLCECPAKVLEWQKTFTKVLRRPLPFPTQISLLSYNPHDRPVLSAYSLKVPNRAGNLLKGSGKVSVFP